MMDKVRENYAVNKKILEDALQGYSRIKISFVMVNGRV